MKQISIIVLTFLTLTAYGQSEYNYVHFNKLNPALTTVKTQTQGTTQPKQYRNKGERFRMEAPPLLYQQYTNGRLMTGFGLALTITGGVAMGTGGVLAVFSNMFQYGILTESVVLFAIGGVCLTTGVPLMIIGGTKKRNAYNTFRKEYPAKQAISNFQLNLHGNCLKFTYVF